MAAMTNETKRVVFLIRNADQETTMKFSTYAKIQRYRNPEFLDSLVGLYEDVMILASQGDTGARSLLERNNINTVAVVN
jgi:hypothetical protein